MENSLQPLQILHRFSLFPLDTSTNSITLTLNHSIMSKVSIADVVATLKASKIEPAITRRIVEELNLKAAQATAAKEDNGPKAKTKLIALASDPEGKLIGLDIVGWIFQVDEACDPSTIATRIQRAAAAYHSTKKGALYPAKNIADAVQMLPRKFWKSETDVSIRTTVKTKEPIQFVTTSGKLD